MHLTRRQLLAAGAGVVSATALAACGSTPASTAKAPAKPTTASYRSRPDLSPPLISVTGPVGQPAAGYLCITPAGPLIVDNAGDPLWVHPVVHASTNLQVQALDGEPVLSWWEGEVASYGVGHAGRYVVVDSSYRPLLTVEAQEGLSADLHEFLIAPDGTAYFTAYRTYTADLRSVGGPRRGTALDATVQGVDLHSGQLVFDWHSTDHIDLTETYTTYSSTTPFDPVHLNSVDVTEDGTLLLSARNTWTLYEVDPSDGSILWRLGGKKSDFTLEHGARFAWQHDARVHPDGVISLFDDEATPAEASQSRGLVLQVDEEARTVTMLRQYRHQHPHLLVGSQGSVQLLSNTNVLVGWGAQPYYTEYRQDGTQVLDARIEQGQSYRAQRYPWTGTPTELPAIAVDRSGADRLVVYASWNGSTETASWEVLAGTSTDALAPVARADRHGFETTIEVSGGYSAVAASALGSDGSVLAASSTTLI